jgi:phosphoribosylformimino-5-aminoimidazole carboxamide ribotide isomerase
MKIIPVMDLMNGLVVHARRGERDNYQPIVSTLCPSATPEDILQAFIERFDCRTVYIADLDAIRYQRPQFDLIEKLKRRFESLEFWLDNGVRDFKSFLTIHESALAVPVIGSECITEILWLESLLKDAWILSLDFKANVFLGDANLLSRTSIWPQRILAMNLTQVGSENGPDFPLLSDLKKRNSVAKIFAAGGVRDNADLANLKQIGVHGTLIATALHNGSIVASDL